MELDLFISKLLRDWLNGKYLLKATYNPKVNYGLWMIIMCQCRFIFGEKCTILVSNVDNGEVVFVREVGSIWRISALSFQFCCKPKLL